MLWLQVKKGQPKYLSQPKDDLLCHQIDPHAWVLPVSITKVQWGNDFRGMT
jgi:hypothetical protein